MNSKELAYAKQGALAAKNWDTFQAVMRKSLKTVVSQGNPPQGLFACGNCPLTQTS
jgi:hypothetical protein